MSSYSTDRRGALKIIGAIGATCAYPFGGDELFGQVTPEHHHHESGKAVPLPANPSYFREADFQTISRLTDLIIPATDTPGAVGAGVPLYIDLVVGRNTGQQQLVADGLRWLDEEGSRLAGKKFIELTEAQQLSVLHPLCDAADAGKSKARNVQFFALIKNLTADGYYTSRIGLIQELGYTGDTVLSSFPECVHEH